LRLSLTAASSRLRPPGAPRLRTVFLDLGDTLMHVHPDVPTLYLDMCLELGLSVDAVQVDRALRAGERMYRDALRSGRTFESSVAEARSFWQEYNEHVLGAMGVEGPLAELARRLSERFWAPESWRALCRTHELDGYFDCIVASTTSGAQKPDVAIFREALRRTGADPASSIHVGDNYIADVLGARAAGIDAVLLDRSRGGGRGMFDFALRDGLGGTAGLRLDCPVISDLRGLLTLL
jgi:putative hydrolase of the HAD superfamily